jgi:Tfp pilus assembly protein PilO
MTGRNRLVLASVGVLLLLVAFFMFFIRPRQNELKQVRSEIETEEQTSLSLQSELDRLRDLQANAPELQAELATIRGYVPNDDQVPNFIFLVQDAANAAGVDFVSITPELPKPPPEGAPLAEVRAQLGAGGGYFALQDFIRRLHGLDRAVRLDNIALAAEQNPTTGETRVTLTASSRIFFEPPATAAGTATAPGGTSTAPAVTPTPAPSPTP